MLAMLQLWHRRYFSDPQAVILTFLLLIGLLVMIFFGRMLTPLLIAIIIAYLLEGPISWMEAKGIRRLYGISLVLVLFVLLVLVGSFAVFPILWSQLADLFRDLPGYIARGQQVLLNLPERYPLITEAQVREMVNTIRNQVGTMGQEVLAISLASVANLITLLVYLVLVPFLVFFLLKDKRVIMEWISLRLPRERSAAQYLWHDLDAQMGNYVRGKFWEIMIVGVFTHICFVLLGVDYALLLATLTGLSVLIPYVGAVVITIPVVMIGYFQWGMGSDLLWLLLVYGIIQGIDGNVLNPLLFAKAVNLHPVAIIGAIMVFGGLWGFWGIFFAIPLATLVNAVIICWPKTPDPQPNPAD